jgi:hypothetical protein
MLLHMEQITSTDMTPSHDGSCGVFDSSTLLVPTIDTHQARAVLGVSLAPHCSRVRVILSFASIHSLLFAWVFLSPFPAFA